MRKTIVFLLSLVILLSLLPRVYAQDAGQAKEPRIVCLNAERCDYCDGQECDLNPNCSGQANESIEHRAVLTQASDKVLPGKEGYVFDCLALTEDGSNIVCTTGNSATDLEIFGTDNLQTLKDTAEYYFSGFYKEDGLTSIVQPVSIAEMNAFATGSKFEWEDHNPHVSFGRRFYALNYLDQEIGTGGAIEGNEASQKQTMEVQFSQGPEGLDKSCASVYWDPYGRVFDSTTLEPITGAQVTLLMKRKDGSFTPMTSGDLVGGYLVNPQTTDVDGVFNFVVPEGDYKLAVSHPNYDFPITKDKLNPNYLRIYKSAYPLKTGDVIVERIDTPGERLRGRPDIERRDVPLIPKTAGLVSEIKLMELFHEKIKRTGNSFIDGRVSHPFAFIDVYSQKFDINGNKTRGELISSTQADRLGFFQLKVEETKFAPGEFFGEIVYYKTDLTNPNKKPVAPVAKKTDIEPIPNYIEGYAYNNEGKILPRATVGVYLSFSTKPYYVTTADEKGYYKIASTHLPFFPYSLKYTSSTGQIVTLGTAKFISQNNQFIEGAKIDLVNFRDEKGNKLSTQDIAKLNLKEQEKQSLSSQQLNNGDNNKKNIILAIVVLLILIVGVLVFGLVYLVKKGKETSSTF